MARLIIMCGFPGCGKSTVLAQHPNTVVLCPDDFRIELTGHEYFAPAEEYVWATVKLTARVLLKKGRDVVIDATHLTKNSRSQWVRIAQPMGIPVIVWWVKTSFEICCERNALRQRVVPTEIMQRMLDGFEPPQLEEGFESIEDLLPDSPSAVGTDQTLS